jgi:hypothetical protein
MNDSTILDLDGCKDEKTGLYSKTNIEKIKKKYVEESKSKMTCIYKLHKNSKLRFYACRDIAEGEELFWPYGTDYWIEWIIWTTEDPIKLLFCHLLKNRVKFDEEKKITIGFYSDELTKRVLPIMDRIPLELIKSLKIEDKKKPEQLYIIAKMMK